ncbi:unnamed protein product [Chrysodeixis includens]|uniref:Uncharacterized protein n=1 Tax=Chrysodeixis includens TaxID=689277 RepID=A0A9N8KU99_CHRIL|nr:unnamed protein product [Chrysodeixis includens]
MQTMIVCLWRRRTCAPRPPPASRPSCVSTDTCSSPNVYLSGALEEGSLDGRHRVVFTLFVVHVALARLYTCAALVKQARVKRLRWAAAARRLRPVGADTLTSAGRRHPRLSDR